MRLTQREQISPLFLGNVEEYLCALLAGLCGFLSPAEAVVAMLDVVIARGFCKRDQGFFPSFWHVLALKLQYLHLLKTLYHMRALAIAIPRGIRPDQRAIAPHADPFLLHLRRILRRHPDLAWIPMRA
jgi:hypothetical protein